jgi:hypothetical protein
LPTLATAATGIIVKFGGQAIPELTNATDIGMAFNMVDVSAHDGNGWSSSIPTLKRGKPITLEMNFVPGNAVQGSLFVAAMSRASTAVQVVLPTTGNPTWDFNAFVGDIGIAAAPVDGALPLRAILTPDGAMDLSIP